MGAAKLVLSYTKRNKATEIMYFQKFAKEETKSRKDKRSCEVKLSLMSDKHNKESRSWNTRVLAMKINFDEE